MADNYNYAFKGVDNIEIPKLILNSSHVYHQYTLKIKDNKRDELRNYLNSMGIPTMIYYPIPLHKQEAFSSYIDDDFYLTNTEILSKTVLSLPIHSEIENANQDYIITQVLNFFK